ncbi:MAG: putative ABC transporter ATP-binding protein YhaQ [Gemmatimonadota bacterium]|nr:MAG: putative ABC transporter ATP-binding protein YhaQ [Gemmatimonadota bacterium]
MPVQPAAVVRNDALRLEGVVKSFDRHRAVDGLDLTVPRGSIYGLLGPNGAGKTTTIRMLMGILRPDAGRIHVLGEPASEATKDRIGYLPEERGLYPGMKVLDNLLFFGALRGLSTAEARAAAGKWLARLRMESTALRKLQELSKGNQQKIQFVATVLHEPELLVLDEPFSGLDPVNQDLMRTTILDLAAQGKTIVLSTHLMDEVERLCSHLTLIHAGRAIVQGALDDVRREHGGETVHLELEPGQELDERHPAIVEVRRVGRSLEIQLGAGADPSAFLSEVAAQVRVRRFEVRGASLHSIFVRLVSADDPAEVPTLPASAPRVPEAPLTGGGR